ncbi:hypothetical protein KCP75_09165 [Salmonella enterica subsp. enterica]|nr:hypothetical protein KCP75_09165 [Salmonella enterica subsp. enterica]
MDIMILWNLPHLLPSFHAGFQRPSHRCRKGLRSKQHLIPFIGYYFAVFHAIKPKGGNDPPLTTGRGLRLERCQPGGKSDEKKANQRGSTLPVSFGTRIVGYKAPEN